MEGQAKQGYPVPSRLPEIDPSMISEDPMEADRILSDYEKNLPQFMKDMKEPIITEQDAWEYPNVSTEVSTFNRRIDKTTPQVIDTIRRVANYKPHVGEGVVGRESLFERLSDLSQPKKPLNT